MVSERPGSEAVLAALLPGCVADVRIRRGEIPNHLPDAVVRGVLYEASRSEALIEIPDIARLHIRRDEIVVAPLVPVATDVLGRYLRRTPLAALMLMRGGFACNGAAVAGPDGSALLTGKTASGKSTLAAALIKRGARLLADDAAPIFFDSSQTACIAPVWPELVLWPDAAKELFGGTPDGFQKADGAIANWTLDDCLFCSTAMPIKGIYLLVSDKLEDETTQQAITGIAKLLRGALMPYQPELAAALVDPAVLLRLYGAIGAGVHTVKLPWRGIKEMDALADRIMQDCGWRSPI